MFMIGGMSIEPMVVVVQVQMDLRQGGQQLSDAVIGNLRMIEIERFEIR